MAENEFFTFREYMRKDDVTASMEDYLEMICRLIQGSGFTRINDLAAALNVQPPSATKMVQKLAELGFVKYEKYGVVMLSEKGQATGQALLKRHQTIEDFLRLLGITEGLLQETEKIEHTISNHTLKALTLLIHFFRDNPELIEELRNYQKHNR